jgi:hypothetical protein
LFDKLDFLGRRGFSERGLGLVAGDQTADIGLVFDDDDDGKQDVEFGRLNLIEIERKGN